MTAGDLISRDDFLLKRWTRCLFVLQAVLSLSGLTVRAQERAGYDTAAAGFSLSDKNPAAPACDPFSKGNFELEFLGGGNSSTLFPDARHPRITFVGGELRFGRIVSNVMGRGFYRGNFEILLGAFAAGVTDGPGSWLVGGNVLCRYNFVQPKARVVPYLQVTGGGLANDIYRDHAQRLIGGGFEFILGAGAGVRFPIGRHFGLLLEGGWQHMSNAGIYSRNRGLNTFGAHAGAFYLF